MSIPDFQSVMLPLLNFASDQQEHAFREGLENMAQVFQLSDEERKERLPSGRNFTFNSRVHWALTYLKQAGLLESTRRGYFQITLRGLQVLHQPPLKINVAFLSQYPEFLKFREISKKDKNGEEVEAEKITQQTPEELLEDGYQRIREELAHDLLTNITACSPGFFERLVVELLVTMGYGGSRKDAGEAIGKSGDEGIDGIIKEDRLGLDVSYIQAKKWGSSVGRPEIHKFVGALQGQQAQKGIFITTSDFTRDAREYVARISSKVVLIDGKQLAQFMIDHNVGVSTVSRYEIKKIDTDYFSEL